MKKETLIATALGITSGIAIAVILIINGQKDATKNLNSYQPAVITPQITFEPKKNQPLLITSPNNKTIINSDSIIITGMAPKNSLLVFQSAYTEVVKRTKSTQFKILFPLSKGENIIKIVQYLDKTTEAKELTVYNAGN